jgi:hypothetical protein
MKSSSKKISRVTVTTEQGSVELKSNCQLIAGGWYLINRDCELINGEWRRKATLFYDNELKVHTPSRYTLTEGVIDIKADGTFVYGYFSPNPYTNVVLQSPKLKDSAATVQTYKLLEGREMFLRRRGTDEWYDKTVLSTSSKINYNSVQNVMDFTGKGYNIEDNSAEFASKIKLYDNYDLKLSKDVRRYARLLGDLSWGAELELAKGCLAPSIQNRCGVVFCRDGSTSSSGEAVTIPYRGAKGLQTLNDLAEVANQDMKLDTSCSFHLHIGGVEMTRDFLVTIYRLCEKTQDEWFTMFPVYKRLWEGVKKKNYCQKLTTKFPAFNAEGRQSNFKEYIAMAYKQLFYFLSDEHAACERYNSGVLKHPIDLKWNRKSR